MERYQTFGRRLLAGILDALLFVPLDYIHGRVWGLELHTTIDVAWLLLYFLAFSSYVVFMHARYGQTFGKMITGITVLSVRDESSISFEHAFLRESPYIFLVLTGWLLTSYILLSGSDVSKFDSIALNIERIGLGWFLIEVITMLFNAKRRALHDYIAGTVVVVNVK